MIFFLSTKHNSVIDKLFSLEFIYRSFLLDFFLGLHLNQTVKRESMKYDDYFLST